MTSTMMDQFLGELCRAEGGCGTALLSPAIDVAEDGAAITVSAELPGLERKDVEVSVKDGVLAIRGEKRREAGSDEGRFHRVERRYGSFYRALSLPETVDAEGIDARFKDGVLVVTLPKRPEAKARAIEIR